MEIFELIITCKVNQSHHYLSNNEHLGAFINECMLHDQELKKHHQKQGFKYYVYQTLYPAEKDRFYKEGSIYVYRLRTLNKSLSFAFQQALKHSNAFFTTIAIERRVLPQKHIFELKTLTPVITSVDSRPLLKEHGIYAIQNQIQANAEKKYNDFHNKTERFQPFIQSIELLNHKPIALTYKGKKMLGNRVRLFVNEDEASQTLANVVIGSGLGEKNSVLGAGYLLYY